MTKKTKPDLQLSTLLSNLDSKGVFETHFAKYHRDDNRDVYVEWGFSQLYVEIPVIWRSSSEIVKREILGLALKRAQGQKVPQYGPKSIAHLMLCGYSVPKSILASISDVKSDRASDLFDYSDWVKTHTTGHTSAKTLDLESRTIVDAGNWKWTYVE